MSKCVNLFHHQGGTGVIFSKGLLRLLAPKLKDCLNNFLTIHDDVEIGRCVYLVSGTRCTMSYESMRFFYQNYNNGVTYSPNIVNISTKTIGKFCTVCKSV